MSRGGVRPGAGRPAGTLRAVEREELRARVPVETAARFDARAVARGMKRTALLVELIEREASR